MWVNFEAIKKERNISGNIFDPAEIERQPKTGKSKHH